MNNLSERARQFAESLPQAYREACRADAIETHARIFERRDGLVEIGVFERRGDLTAVCIIAQDQPGLLSFISEALVVCGIDVVNAEAFTIKEKNQQTAVDLFWLRRLEAARVLPLEQADIERLRTTLVELLERKHISSEIPLTGGTTTSESRVRFIEDEEGGLCTLEIETEDRSGLLLSVSKALFAQRVQVLRCEVRTESTRRVMDRFTIAESDGSPVDANRRLEIQVAVLAAIEPAKRLASTAPPAAET